MSNLFRATRIDDHARLSCAWYRYCYKGVMSSAHSKSRHTGEKLFRVVSRGFRLRALVIVIALAFSVTTIHGMPSGLRLAQASDQTSIISRHGITWTFNREVEFGRFVNGDYWVVGPVTIIDISPLSTVEDGRTRNGSMINPHRGLTQGYDSHPKSGGYSSTNNVGRPGGNRLSAANPLRLQPGDSLVSARSGEPARRWPPGQLDDAAVLTVVDGPPPEGSFRPPYTNGSKAYRWNVADINWDALEARQVQRSRLGTLPNLSGFAARVERVWLDHSQAWQFGHVVPANNMPSYGREFQKSVGDTMLTLLLDYPRAELEPIVYGFLQVGIDLFALAELGQTWGANGAIFGGRKLPILFAGWLFNNPVASAMLDIADAEQNLIFQEDQQVHPVTQQLIDCSQANPDGGGCWNPDKRNSQFAPYPQEMLNIPEWGIRFSAWLPSSTSQWAPDASWRAIYRNNNVGAAGMALAALIAGLRSEWNNDAFFDYYDRAYRARPVADGGSGDDPMGIHGDWNVKTNGLTTLAFNMWEEFRNDYLPVWSPD